MKVPAPVKSAVQLVVVKAQECAKALAAAAAPILVGAGLDVLTSISVDPKYGALTAVAAFVLTYFKRNRPQVAA